MKNSLELLLRTIEGYSPNKHASKCSSESFQNNLQKVPDRPGARFQFGTSENPGCIPFICLELAFMYALRATEILRINCRNILKNGSCIVYGNKRSRSRLISHPFFKSFVNHRCPAPGCKLFPISYSQFYRYAQKQWSNGKGYERNKSHAPIHGLRYILLQESSCNEMNNSLVLKDIIGHNSIHSQNYYLKGKSHG